MKSFLIYIVLILSCSGLISCSSESVSDDKSENILKLANQEDADAQYRLGEMYRLGESLTQNYEQAVKWYTKSAKQGNADAQYNLGLAYLKGEGATQDYKLAIYWFTKSVEQGNADAQNVLGFMYLKGEGVTQNYKQASKWYIKSAERGNPYAQSNLGSMYYYGVGFTQDHKQALHWFTRSSSQNIDTQNSIESMYLNSEGVFQNFQQILYWLTQIAKQKNAGTKTTVLSEIEFIKKIMKMERKSWDYTYILTEKLKKNTFLQTKQLHVAYLFSCDSFFFSPIYSNDKDLSCQLIIENLSKKNLLLYRELFNKFIQWYNINQKERLRIEGKEIGRVEEKLLLYVGQWEPNKNTLFITDKNFYKNSLHFSKKDVEALLKFFTEANISLAKSKAINHRNIEIKDKIITDIKWTEREKKREKKIDELFN